MAVYVNREGIEQCISKINSAIEALKEAAGEVDAAMNELPEYWQGNAFENAKATYEEQYQNLLKNTIPQSVDEFKTYISDCKKAIIELDEQLS